MRCCDRSDAGKVLEVEWSGKALGQKRDLRGSWKEEQLLKLK